jgi:hypothetical protein
LKDKKFLAKELEEFEKTEDKMTDQIHVLKKEIKE